MTREEALRNLDILNSIIKDGVFFVEGVSIEALVNDIYDDLEFRRCKNCIDYAKKDGYCRELQIDGFRENFGCTDFKPKIKAKK